MPTFSENFTSRFTSAAWGVASVGLGIGTAMAAPRPETGVAVATAACLTGILMLPRLRPITIACAFALAGTAAATAQGNLAVIAKPAPVAPCHK